MVDPNKVGDWFLHELFRRLPLKSLFKFKCVSKRWLSLISDPFMGRLYLPRADHVPVYTLLFYNNLSLELVGHPKRFEPINFRLGFVPKDPQHFNIMDAHNGLLLSTDFKSHNYYVSDPLTARWAALPHPPALPVDYTLGNVSLIVYDSRPLYRVILIHELGPERVLMDSFDSRTMHWKSSAVALACPVGERDFVRRGPGILYKGSLHWIAMRSHKIVAYDPAAHESQGVDYRCRVFDCPPGMLLRGERRSSYVILGLSAGGEIRYAELEMAYSFGKPLFMCVWILKDYDSAEWCLEHEIYQPDVIYVGFDQVIDPIDDRTSCFLSPYMFDPIDMDVIYFTATLSPDTTGVACYNISTATMKIVFTCDDLLSTAFFSFLPWPTLL